MSKQLQKKLDMLNDEKKEVKIEGITFFLKFPSQDAIKSLITLLNDTDYEVRSLAIKALGEVAFDVKDKVNLLLPKLKDIDMFVRIATLKVLGELQDLGSVEAILELLNDDNKPVKGAACVILGQFKAEKTIQPIIDTLQNEKDSFVRQCCISALGHMKNKQVIELLIELLESEKDGRVRTVIVCSLGNFNDERIFDPLLNAALYDLSTDVCSYAVLSLEQFGERTLSALLRELSNNDPNVRLNVIWALGQLGGNQELKSLIKWKDHEDGITSYGVKLKSVIEDAIENIQRRIVTTA